MQSILPEDTQVDEHSLLNQYRHIVDATNIVSKTDPRGIITYANKKFVEISGYAHEELIGKPHNILRDPDMPASIFKELWQTIEQKEVWSGVITNRRKDGSRYTVEATIFPILDADGVIVEYIAIRHDISQLLELNAKLERKRTKIEQLRAHDIEQQQIAKEKLEAGIVNDLARDSCQIIYAPSDILNGDFYSLYRREDGSIFLYLIDGQGHGASPALTVFAVSSTIKQLVKRSQTLTELVNALFPAIKVFLDSYEQLSYTMLLLSPDGQELEYASGGMYPFLIKQGESITKLVTNNIPFMDFSEPPEVTSVHIGEWEALLLYSDGIIEHENSGFNKFSPDKLINHPNRIDTLSNLINDMELDDDVTVIYIKNSEQPKEPS